MKQMNQLLRQTIINGSKKTTLILALFLTVGTSFSFATGATGNDGTNGIGANNNTSATSGTNAIANANGVTRLVSTSFKQDFKNAQVLSSEVHNKFTKLTFRANDMILSAFYGDNGKLIAVVRNILSSQLPTDLMLDLKKNYSDFWITELFELNSDGQTGYYVALENADTKLILRSNSDNTWEVYQQTDKN
jgi:hypothetical protein